MDLHRNTQKSGMVTTCTLPHKTRPTFVLQHVPTFVRQHVQKPQRGKTSEAPRRYSRHAACNYMYICNNCLCITIYVYI